MHVLSRLSGMGVRLAIDDFGTGYSSLSYLKRLPVDALKIDKSFIQGMEADENDAVIVKSTIDLGRNLGLHVVAEGVETKEAWRQLLVLGCDVAQGYYLSRPVPAAELAAWVRASREGRALSA
jgi:EAL domain-containing protein (putative c-di-GMP-specific phosphodiesterase class I)